MTTHIRLEELLVRAEGPLGESRFVTVGRDRTEAFQRATALELEGGAAPPPAEEEVDSFHLLGLLSSLLADALVVTDAGAQALVGIERVRFVTSPPPGTRVSARAALVSAERTEEGYVLCRIGGALFAEGEELPLLVGELLFLAGNPGQVGVGAEGGRRGKGPGARAAG